MKRSCDFEESESRENGALEKKSRKTWAWPPNPYAGLQEVNKFPPKLLTKIIGESAVIRSQEKYCETLQEFGPNYRSRSVPGISVVLHSSISELSNVCVLWKNILRPCWEDVKQELLSREPALRYRSIPQQMTLYADDAVLPLSPMMTGQNGSVIKVIGDQLIQYQVGNIDKERLRVNLTELSRFDVNVDNQIVAFTSEDETGEPVVLILGLTPTNVYYMKCFKMNQNQIVPIHQWNFPRLPASIRCCNNKVMISYSSSSDNNLQESTLTVLSTGVDEVSVAWSSEYKEGQGYEEAPPVTDVGQGHAQGQSESPPVTDVGQGHAQGPSESPPVTDVSQGQAQGQSESLPVSDVGQGHAQGQSESPPVSDMGQGHAQGQSESPPISDVGQGHEEEPPVYSNSNSTPLTLAQICKDHVTITDGYGVTLQASNGRCRLIHQSGRVVYPRFLGYDRSSQRPSGVELKWIHRASGVFMVKDLHNLPAVYSVYNDADKIDNAVVAPDYDVA